MRAQDETKKPPRDEGDRALRSISSLRTAFQAIAAPATLTMGVLFFFGWNRAEAGARYFGLDQSLLDFSTQDYLLRSVDAMFLPIVAVLVTALAWISLDHALYARIGANPTD
ncbi:MAG: hypothetical protein LC733_09030 [Actinobacteria bacterium]|nr:hypothetical protein [Actinomycetota bacterium]